MATLVIRSRSQTGAAATNGKKRSCEFSKLNTPSTPSAWSSGARCAASSTDCESWTSTFMSGPYRVGTHGAPRPDSARLLSAKEDTVKPDDHYIVITADSHA